MIESFRCADARALFEGRRVPRFVNIETVAMRRLQQLNAAASLAFQRVPPQNRLEALKGDRNGQWSIRINAVALVLCLGGRPRPSGRDHRLPLTKGQPHGS